ncbi:MAG: sigma-54-dependent Fis family transcriptional regulator [Myxococcales bacterium]|nr:sigma-54-dependent Fis family transcriptional regulator [Myxococcales bacterium]
MNSTSAEPLRVLLVDDDQAFGTAMAKALRRRGFEVSVLDGGAEAVLALGGRAGPAPHVAVLDLRMPDVGGLEVLRRTPARTVPVVVLTGHGSVPDAVEAMRLGAYTFLTKPVDAADLAPILEQAAAPASPALALVGKSPATAGLRELLARLADADEPVLLTGETGTGKEVAARTLHHGSRRTDAPFLAVNMACLPGELVESELFGHVRGAFTGADRGKPGLFAEVGNGTLFLDEVGELPLAHQAKLLRVLETRTFRAVGDTREQTFRGRLVAATHRDLRREVLEGRFREDLFYRLQVLPLELPPLRHRREDILPIVQHWLGRVASQALAVSPEAEALLLAHEWPGNVREVVNLARRVALFAEGGQVTAELVRRMLAANPFVQTAAAAAPVTTPPEGLTEGAVEEISLEALERRHILGLLAHHKNVTHVARILEINRRTLQRKLKAWGIEHDDLP